MMQHNKAWFRGNKAWLRATAWHLGLIVLGFIFVGGGSTALADEKKDENDQQTQIRRLIDEAKYHEIYGRQTMRDRVLKKAEALAGGDHASVQAMKGRVNDGVNWKTPNEIAKQTLADETHQRYLILRKTTADNLQGQTQLATWCQRNGLPNQFRAHLNRALWHAPNNTQIRVLLGHRQIEGRWVTPQQMSEEVMQLVVTQKRFDAWREEVLTIRKELDQPSSKRRETAIKKIRKINDASSIPALEVALANYDSDVCKEVIRKLAQFKETESSLALTRLALDSPWFSCRQMATKALAKRDRYQFVPTLLSQMVSPVISRVAVIPGARGQVLYRHIYLQRRMDADVVKQYDTVYQRISSGLTNGSDSLRQTMRDIRRNVPTNERLKARENISVEQNNQRIAKVLTEVIGLRLGNDAESWWKWWNDYNEVYTSLRPVEYDRFVRQVEVYDRDLTLLNPISSAPGQTGPRLQSGGGGECLVAGTVIGTDRGPVAVEQIQVGDRVLSQNVETGQLEYKIVIRPTVRPKTKTFDIRLSKETIRCSGGHPFWVAGQGWTKARDLKAGMPLSCAGGISMILETRPAQETELYNLVVEDNSNYFVGESRLLSHDNTIPKPTLRLVPGMSK